MQRRVAAITGACGTLGSAVVSYFSDRGVQVAAIDLAENARAAFRPDVLFLGRQNLADEGQANICIRRVIEKFGQIDFLINLAGGFKWERVRDGDGDTWRTLYELNVMTAFTTCKAAIPALLESRQARIINMGAFAALHAKDGMGSYTASKAAVHRLTEALADEWKGRISVNAVLPSIIDTPQNRADMPDADFAKWVNPFDIANLIGFLTSESAAAITGTLIPITGHL